jgi:DNA-binding Lrp family transcriptional regulator
MKMIEMLMTGANQTDIAQRFRLTPRTIRNEMEFLEKEGLLKRTEEQILTDLYPLALKVMKKHLTEQEARVGQTSIDGAKAVLKEPLKRAAIGETQVEEMTLERWVIERRAKREPAIEGEISNVAISGPDGSAPRVLDAHSEGSGEQVQGGHDNQREESGSVGTQRGSGPTEPPAKS